MKEMLNKFFKNTNVVIFDGLNFYVCVDDYMFHNYFVLRVPELV
jgi:hypothetical protein